MQTEDTKRRNGSVFHHASICNLENFEAIILNEIISCCEQLKSL